jgi:RNA recognition motif-containing protein
MPDPPIYSTSTNGMPVNVRGRAILIEARSVFIRNLSYRCTQDDLNRLLQTVGYPIHSQLQLDRRTGVFKGAATAKFASKELAQHAANTLNGREHIGITIHVRIDTNTTVVRRAEPIVVNRSYGVSTQSLSSFLQLTTSSTKSHLPGNWYYSISEGNRRRQRPVCMSRV